MLITREVSVMQNEILTQLKENEGKYDGLTLTVNKEVFLLHATNNKETKNVDIEVLRNDELQATIFDAYPINVDQKTVSEMQEVFGSVNEKIATAISNVENN